MGLGGILFNHITNDNENISNFLIDLGREFINLYSPFLEKYINKDFTNIEKEYQLLKRYAYTEFWYIYNQKIKANPDNIGEIKFLIELLPPTMINDSGYKLGEREKKMEKYFKNPIDWIDIVYYY